MHWQFISYIMIYIWHLSNVTINQDKPSSISTNPTWNLDANQFTSKPVIVKQSYLMIMISDEGKLGSIGKLIQRAIILYFIITKSKRPINRSLKIWFRKFDQPSFDLWLVKLMTDAIGEKPRVQSIVLAADATGEKTESLIDLTWIFKKGQFCNFTS